MRGLGRHHRPVHRGAFPSGLFFARCRGGALLFSFLSWVPFRLLAVLATTAPIDMTWLCAALIVRALLQQTTDSPLIDAARIALKLTPAVFGLIFVLRKQWREALTAVISGLGFTAFAWLILSEDSYQYWTSTLFNSSRIGGLAYSSNQSIRGFLARVTGQTQNSALWIFRTVISTIVIAQVILIALRRGAVVASVGANALIALLCSPVAWAHH